MTVAMFIGKNMQDVYEVCPYFFLRKIVERWIFVIKSQSLSIRKISDTKYSNLVFSYNFHGNKLKMSDISGYTLSFS